ncbi:hypothetical protein M2350_001163 [Candidatus Fervidibacter sacchari]|uniref:Uncharacterized protein n=1 Tax=Candidatus Fervidibacter sacchari TaxID=1448929 RepID=A0ABT2EPD7_9BACT|nr:hypothetical protein [Candidatus Fervidibacter sacchari]
MRREGWTLCLMMTLTLIVAWLIFGVPKAIIGSWPACQDMNNCGECEIMLRPSYLMPVCEQKNCELLNADPPVNQLPTSLNTQVIYCGYQLELYRRKAWSDCNGDNVADCECWTIYWRDKFDPSHWFIGLAPCEE